MKRHFNHERLAALVNGELFDMTKHIKKALKKITPELVAACARKSLFLLKDFKST